MKYIYESHMGGLYCTDYEDNDTYCEECGDSDWLLGTASTIEQAWELLKNSTDTFDNSICEKCPHNEDYDYCDEKCKENMNSGGYSLSYIMRFLVENFECKKMHYIYLISRYVEDNDYVLVDCDVKGGYKFGERHALPYNTSLFEEYVPMMARSITTMLDGPCKDLKKVAVRKTHNGFIHIYECIEEIDEECPKENWKDISSYRNESWYGYMCKDKIKLIEDQKELQQYL